MIGDPVPLEAQALMLMITDRLAPFVKPVIGVQGRSLSFKQFDNGTVLIGGAFRGRAEHNRTHLDPRGLAANAANAAVTNRNRCRMHGGKSTGPRTLAGKARVIAANTKHGRRSKAHAARIREINARLRRITCELKLAGLIT
jgi:hypothetical protein